MRFGRLVLLGALCAVSLAPAAYADAIDGQWCHVDGRRMQINGSTVVTPHGATLSGAYSRHFFSYVAPDAEPGAGRTVALTLVDEMTVLRRIGDGDAETWRRCGPPISLRQPGTKERRTGNG
jgi:hypothetical protein